MLALLIACHHSSPSDDDSAPSEVTDTGPKVFDPETDLEWAVAEGTDGDCGTAWPLGAGPWSYTSTVHDPYGGTDGKTSSSSDAWTTSLALSRDDVWDVSLAIYFSMGMGHKAVDATFRVQCDGARILVLGVTNGNNSYSDDLVIGSHQYAASFAAPIVVGLADSAFDVDGQLWHAEDYEYPLPTEAEVAHFSGTITDVGTETVATPGGDVASLHLFVRTDSDLLVDLFPKHLWLSESAGLVQFSGPIGDTASVLAN